MTSEPISVAWFSERRGKSASSRWRGWAVVALTLAVLWLWRLPQISALVKWSTLAAALIAAGCYARYRRIHWLGPVCFHDLICTGRQGRYRWSRCAYALLLLMILGWVFASWTARTATDTGWAALFSTTLPVESMPRFAASFFYTFIWAQAVVLVLLTPIYVAGSIAAEKEHQTLAQLFTTELADHEIVLGKLVSRLAHLLLLLLCGLPILSFLQFFGGVDPELLLAAFAATAAMTTSVASLSILRSVVAARVADAVLGTYLSAVGYFLISLLLYALIHIINVVVGAALYVADLPPMDIAIPYFNLGNPLLAVVQLERAFRTAGSITTAVGQIATEFVLFHLLYALLLCWRAIGLVRREGLRVEAPLPLWRRPGFEFPPRLHRPRLRHQAAFLWKETHVDSAMGSPRFGSLLMFLQLVFGWLLVSLFVLGLLLGISEMSASTLTNLLLRRLGVTLASAMLLAVAINAAGSVSRERERQTLDSLLLLPVEPREVIGAKWLGPILVMRPLGWCLAIMAGFALITGGLHLMAAPLLIVAWVIYALFLSGVGMWFSLRFNSIRATALTMTALIALTIVCSLPMEPLRVLIPAIPPATWDDVARIIDKGLRPHAALGSLCFGYDSASKVNRHALNNAGAVICGLLTYSLAAFFLWRSNLRSWLKLTH